MFFLNSNAWHTASESSIPNVDTFHVHEARKPMKLRDESTSRKEKRERSLGKNATQIIYMEKNQIYNFRLEKKTFHFHLK